MSALNMVEICLPVRAVGALECATFENRTPPRYYRKKYFGMLLLEISKGALQCTIWEVKSMQQCLNSVSFFYKGFYCYFNTMDVFL